MSVISNNESLISNLSYTEKDFQTIYPALLDLVKKETSKWDPSASNETDPGVLLLKLNAIIADKCNYNIDKNILECFPISVTQSQNARALFAQLGYYMKWYQAAETTVTLKYTGDKYFDADENEVIYSFSIPMFTMVSDSEKDKIYTIVESKNITSDGEAQTFRALQGIATEFSIDGDTLITSADLDSNNRLYFLDNNVAQNGIFIKNNSAENYSSWEQKDNLLVEEVAESNKFYHFGVSQDSSTCYIEFPENAETLFQDGINITYIKTDGSNGNITIGYLTDFYSTVSFTDPEDSNKTITLSTENTSINNYYYGTGGADPEDIDEAYNNYKKTIGTFNTLVTLRDYMNVINKSGYVTNSIVSDRTTDIQSSYDIISNNGTIIQSINEVELTDKYDVVGYLINGDFYEENSLSSKKYTPNENYNYYDVLTKTTYRVIYRNKVREYIQADAVEKPAMEAFDLKLYLLSTSALMSAATYYNRTFLLNTNESIMNVMETYLDDYKSIQHNIVDILTNKLCFIKLKYPLKCKIITQSSLTATQKNEVADNIRLALYNNLNSSQIEFGQEITYENLFSIVSSADARIKNLYLDPITFTPYAVYLDDNKEVKEIDISQIDTYLKKVFYLNESLTFISGIGKYSDVKFSIIDSYTNILGECSGIEITSDNKVNLLNYTEDDVYYDIYTIYENSAWKNSKYRRLKLENEFEYIDSRLQAWLTNNTYESYYNGYGAIDEKYSLINTFRHEIYAKSVLAGKTQFFIKDNKFEYSLSQSYQLLQDNVGKIRTDFSTEFNDNNDWTIQLQNNESLQLYAPKLLDYASYSSNIRFEYFLKSQNRPISNNTAYMLEEGEYIIFYYTDETSTDSDFLYAIYSKGAIIKPNFTLDSSRQYATDLIGYEMALRVKDTKVGNQVFKYTSGDTLGESEEIRSGIKSLLNAPNLLSGSREITVQLKNSATLKGKSYYCYWILNESYNDRYILFDEDTATNERLLRSGEYFLYMSANSSDVEILGAGTYIIKPSTYRKELSCQAVDYSVLLDQGISGIIDYLVQLNNDLYLEISEMQYSTFSEGYVAKINQSTIQQVNIEDADFGSGTKIEYFFINTGSGKFEISNYTCVVCANDTEMEDAIFSADENVRLFFSGNISSAGYDKNCLYKVVSKKAVKLTRNNSRYLQNVDDLNKLEELRQQGNVKPYDEVYVISEIKLFYMYNAPVKANQKYTLQEDAVLGNELVAVYTKNRLYKSKWDCKVYGPGTIIVPNFDMSFPSPKRTDLFAVAKEYDEKLETKTAYTAPSEGWENTGLTVVDNFYTRYRIDEIDNLKIEDKTYLDDEYNDLKEEDIFVPRALNAPTITNIKFNSNKPVTLYNCSIAYKTSSSNTAWETLEKILLNDKSYTWKGLSLLRLNATKDTPQTLYSNHYIKYYLQDKDQYTPSWDKTKKFIRNTKYTAGSYFWYNPNHDEDKYKYELKEDKIYYVHTSIPTTFDYQELSEIEDYISLSSGIIEPGKSPYDSPTYLLTSETINSIGPLITTISIDSNDNLIPISIYDYNILENGNENIIFRDDGITQVIINELGKVVGEFFIFRLPAGYNYILPMNHSTNDILNDLRVYLNTTEFTKYKSLTDKLFILKNNLNINIDGTFNINFEIYNNNKRTICNSLIINSTDKTIFADNIKIYDNGWIYSTRLYFNNNINNTELKDWLISNSSVILNKLYSMGENNSNFSKKGYYYLKINEMPESISGLYTEIEYKVEPTSESTVTIFYDPIFKYIQSANIYEDDISLNNSEFESIYNKIKELDYNNRFCYNYTVDTDEEVKYPLNGINYLDSNHVFNSYSICQMNTHTDYFDIYIMSNLKTKGKY